MVYLTQRPDQFAETRSPQFGARMDVLSEVLKAVRLDGALFYNGEFSAPWRFRSPASRAVTPYLSPDSGHVIIFRILTSRLVRPFGLQPEDWLGLVTRASAFQAGAQVEVHGDLATPLP